MRKKHKDRLAEAVWSEASMWETNHIDVTGYHVREGIHSRIPACCVAWFVDVWMKISETPHGKAMRRAYLGRWDGHYIPCPSCRERNRPIRVHRCTARCKRKDSFGRHAL